VEAQKKVGFMDFYDVFNILRSHHIFLSLLLLALLALAVVMVGII